MPLKRINLFIVLIVGFISLSIFNIGRIKEIYSQIVEPLSSPTSADESLHDSHQTSEHEFEKHDAGEHHPKHKIIATRPIAKDVVLLQQYVCQIHSRRHIDVCAIEGGYLRTIGVNEGQAVVKGQTLFNILPTLYEARLAADTAEAQLAQVEYDNTQKLVQQNIVSPQELKLAEAKLAKAAARVNLARAEMDFANIKAPFDGIIDRLHEQEGSLVEEGAILTTLSDNSVMWVYFNVPEARYLEYQTTLADGQNQESLHVKLKLANHNLFEQSGKISAIEADFDSETGNIAFRADFPNPDRLLRHGQTGTVLIEREEKGAIVIPQRATFEILAKKYAYVIDSQSVVRQREIVIQNEMDDIFVIGQGLSPDDKIILEGIRQVRDGETIEYQYEEPEKVLADLKLHAE